MEMKMYLGEDEGDNSLETNVLSSAKGSWVNCKFPGYNDKDVRDDECEYINADRNQKIMKQKKSIRKFD